MPLPKDDSTDVLIKQGVFVTRTGWAEAAANFLHPVQQAYRLLPLYKLRDKICFIKQNICVILAVCNLLPAGISLTDLFIK